MPPKPVRVGRKDLTVGLVGATGLVGSALLAVMARRRFPAARLRLWASIRSSGRKIRVGRTTHAVSAIDPSEFRGCDIVFFAGTEGEKGASRLYAGAAIEAGAVVIDNGSDYRMDPGVPLVVPEANSKDALDHRGLIANPNCSTIQMVVALAPVHRRYGLRRIVVATYQSVSGAGRNGITELTNEIRHSTFDIRHSPFPSVIAGNVIPQISDPGDLGYTGEEWKMVRETQKILHDECIAINATTVRVPVMTGHAEAVYFETVKQATARDIERLLAKAPGVAFRKDGFDTPLDAAGRDDVLVSRLRPDPFQKNSFTMWVVADNLLKGAATNAVQIAELLIGRRRP